MSTVEPLLSNTDVLNDVLLERRVQTFLVGQCGARASSIQVAARAGRVRLSGEVADSVDRRVVELLTRRVAGVHEVINELELPLRESSRGDGRGDRRIGPVRRPHVTPRGVAG